MFHWIGSIACRNSLTPLALISERGDARFDCWKILRVELSVVHRYYIDLPVSGLYSAACFSAVSSGPSPRDHTGTSFSRLVDVIHVSHRVLYSVLFWELSQVTILFFVHWQCRLFSRWLFRVYLYSMFRWV